MVSGKIESGFKYLGEWFALILMGLRLLWMNCQMTWSASRANSRNLSMKAIDSQLVVVWQRTHKVVTTNQARHYCQPTLHIQRPTTEC